MCDSFNYAKFLIVSLLFYKLIFLNVLTYESTPPPSLSIKSYMD
jgi:hypothetical protein